MKNALRLCTTCFFASTAQAEENITLSFNSIDQVIGSVSDLLDGFASAGFDANDMAIISGQVAIVGQLRTNIGVTGYDTEPDFKSDYWAHYRTVTGMLRNSIAEVEKRQRFLSENELSEWAEYFSQNVADNADDFVVLLESGGITDQSDQADALASMLGYGLLMGIDAGVTSPKEVEAYAKTFAWPFCRTGPEE